jgi:hypothetical protein
MCTSGPGKPPLHNEKLAGIGGRQSQLGGFIMISSAERNRATASWKDMMEKDFDLYYTPGINSPSPEMRTATAVEYAAYQLGQINLKLDRIIATLGSAT